ncbi:hypothetical protein OSB04_004368 [Centaurea solstitialis]|uniref:Jacalin-type lectin domain-containing protein n=1 Tax=Centaurea solstitialis TaxID=347529 RepID=A0AA38WPP1_9ASTR|nr:hypothetical protein OSB04_004368 [Centaurea solstitialis]
MQETRGGPLLRTGAVCVGVFWGGVPFPSLDVSDLNMVKLHLDIRKNRVVVFRKLLAFLQKFEAIGPWSLVVSSNKNVTIHEELWKIPRLSSTDLKLELIRSPVKLKGYVDNLLRMSRPKTLSLVSSSSSELLKFVKEKIMSREENPNCCTYYLRKCWLHYVKDVTMVVFDAAKDWENRLLSDLTGNLESAKLAQAIGGDGRKKGMWFGVWGGNGSSNGDDGVEKTIRLGPWGGNGGNYWDDGAHSGGVREITIVYGSCIDSIRVTYDEYGKPFSAEKHGGVGGSKSAQIKLRFPEEVLISVSGHYCPVVYGGSPVIRSLTLKTNQRTFGPFGVEEGTPFNFSTDGGLVVGFYGRGGWFLDSIGFYISWPKTGLFNRIHTMFKGFNPMAYKREW